MVYQRNRLQGIESQSTPECREPVNSICFSGQVAKLASTKCAAQSPGIKVSGKSKSTGNQFGDGMHRSNDSLVPIIFADRVEFLLMILQIML